MVEDVANRRVVLKVVVCIKKVKATTACHIGVERLFLEITNFSLIANHQVSVSFDSFQVQVDDK